MNFTSNSQNFEDVILWRALGDVPTGRYIDVGAHDPEIDSVSLAFYKRGWRGIHVEPTPHYANRLRDARPDEQVIEAVVSDEPGAVRFFEFPGTGLSTGRSDIAVQHRERGFDFREIIVGTVTLEDVLALPGSDIHWLKIDVEGMEVDVLRSWRKSTIRPWILVIEATLPGTDHHTEHLWLPEVLSREYVQAMFDGLNFYFVHKAHQELADRLSTPANVFDRFEVAKWHFSAAEIRSELETTTRLLGEEQSRAEGLRKELDGLIQEREHLRLEQRRAVDCISALQQDLREKDAKQNAQVEQAKQEHRQREDYLNAELAAVRQECRIGQERLDAALADGRHARDELNVALGRLVIAEQHHRAMLSSQSRERQIIEQKHLERREELLAQLRQAEATVTSALVEAARSAERNSMLQVRLDEACQNYGTAERRLSESEQARATLSAELERLREMLSHADRLIGSIKAGPRTRWERLGEILGIAQRSAALSAVATWPGAAANSTGLETHSNPIVRETSLMMNRSAAAGLRNPYLRAESLAELLTWCDVDFVRCAYVTMLGRQPDPEGEAHYTNRIRAGDSKLGVLWQLRRSAEGRKHDPGIAGLDRALRRAALARKPLIGPVVRLFAGSEGNDRQTRRWRSLSNSIETVLVAQDRQFAFLQSKLDEVTAALSKEQRVVQEAAPIIDDHNTRPVQLSNLSNRARDIFAAMVNVR